MLINYAGHSSDKLYTMTLEKSQINKEVARRKQLSRKQKRRKDAARNSIAARRKNEPELREKEKSAIAAIGSNARGQRVEAKNMIKKCFGHNSSAIQLQNTSE